MRKFSNEILPPNQLDALFCNDCLSIPIQVAALIDVERAHTSFGIVHEDLSPHPFGVVAHSLLWAMAKERSSYYHVTNIEDGPDTLYGK